MTTGYPRTADPTAAEALLERLRMEHRQKQRAFVTHFRGCYGCGCRYLCPMGEYLADAARASGNALDAEQARADAAAGRA
jgi:NAD-dependent dihydropyrimidine dehydrogenase PreA subunit